MSAMCVRAAACATFCVVTLTVPLGPTRASSDVSCRPKGADLVGPDGYRAYAEELFSH